VSLPRPLLDVLDPPRRERAPSPEDGWRTLPVGASAGVVADLHFDFELSPFNEGVYREDVPKG
jgi:hypothetical protein